ncbi:MAG: excinuclease ABC subunit A [Candidatus Nealsonbacteria bacterium RBG_13_36_15]|uniref:UvrABC system protein A n=1 Tax=Candidatus Nealsonbacteria bacterium RBG_13_36_15 TaxID=1801660 RepID=A0A1G2DVQ5_9BACT|nr:MAG: excinuclease ABC subunit A [Candidatus Nealsonbacteria bacterium RBG_13_36_15]
MAQDFIKIRGAKVHNLKNIDVDIPKNKLVVITGISGSGKSSLAFDTLYAEGQRRYVESLSAYARQFLGVMRKPDAEKIEGISPAISIDQRKAAHNPRSTVGTITEIYDYLRLLFARIGIPHCPKCKKEVSRQTIDQIVEQVLKMPKKTEVTILGPVVRSRKGEHRGLLEEIQRAGFIRARINGIIYRIEESLEKSLDLKKKHNIEVVVDRLIIERGLDKSRLVDSLETALKLGKGIVIVNQKFRKQRPNDLNFSEHFACEDCGISLPELEPRLFSFNSPYGACLACQGLGEKLEVDPKLVIPNPNLTVAEGAIQPWMRASHKVGRQSYFWWQLSNLSERINFSLSEPVKNLPQKIIEIILYGDGEFEGVIPSLERRYRETDSNYTREEIEQYMIEKKCKLCQGKRLKPEALATIIAKTSIDQMVEMSIGKLEKFFGELLNPRRRTLKSNEMKIAPPIIKEVINRLQFLIDVGLDYLTLNRKASTLAGGEEQRIKLATQIGSKLTGVLYILDEPSVGLHPRDQERLIETLKKLKEIGNTVVVVEHDPQTIRAADWIIDIGPGAGKHGGRVIFKGTPRELMKAKTLTGEYMSGRKKVEIESRGSYLVSKDKKKTNYQIPDTKYLVIKEAAEHNLKNIDANIPLGKFVCITGVSGSGKSSLMNDVLAKSLLKKFYKTKEDSGKHKEILGAENLNKVVLVDQSPIGRTPRSNPATYTGAFSFIRDLFSKTREAKIRGYQPGRFSFNVKGGRCEVCEGQGQIKIEMFFLPDVYVECQECRGRRFNKETLSIEYKGKNISDVLSMTVEEALGFFKLIPGLFQKLKTLNRVGLGYIQLGQPATSLSGGEAQRIKLSTELSRKATGKTLYILDEPTTGLHPDDIKKLVWVLRSLVDMGNTVLIIEHNLDVIKNSDWIIDLGPEGGERGGYIIAEGTPFEITTNKKSHTGKYLKTALSN